MTTILNWSCIHFYGLRICVVFIVPHSKCPCPCALCAVCVPVNVSFLFPVPVCVPVLVHVPKKTLKDTKTL